jgi:hypothetical protein
MSGDLILTTKGERMPNWNKLTEVFAFALRVAAENPRFPQFIVKYPGRSNYNLTMQPDKALASGARIVWSSK